MLKAMETIELHLLNCLVNKIMYFIGTLFQKLKRSQGFFLSFFGNS